MIRTSTRAVLAAGGAVAGAAIVWGTLIEPRLIDWVDEEAPVPGLPVAWEGATVALVADLQVGVRWANRRTVGAAMEGVACREPALLLVAGDLIQGGGADALRQARDAVAVLRPVLDGEIPVCAVLGNHDWLGADGRFDADVAHGVRATLESAGVRVLENEAARLPPPAGTRDAETRGEALYLVGIGAHLPGSDDGQRALHGIPADAPRVVIMHNPETFKSLPAGAAPFAVAGHTHGGQVRVPFLPSLAPSKLLDPAHYQGDGWSSELGAPGNHLYVTRGLGFSHLPIRFGTPPEVTLFTLRPGGVAT